MIVQNIMNEISKELKDVPGIVGVVLGGSRARGTNHETSDIDIGIYYDTSAGFDVVEVGKKATKLDDDHRENIVSSLGEWGDWINGGGWIVVQGYHVDLIFRDVNRVSQVIDDCLAGTVSAHYHTGHPYAYLNVMYMGEISICTILHDPMSELLHYRQRQSHIRKHSKMRSSAILCLKPLFLLYLLMTTWIKMMCPMLPDIVFGRFPA